MRHRLFLLLIALTTLNCNTYTPRSIGEPNQIILFIAPALKNHIEPQLRKALEVKIETPQYEKIFSLVPVRQDLVHSYTKNFNILFVASLDHPSLGPESLSSLLSRTELNRVASGEQQVFVHGNVWANPQQVVILAGPTAQSIAAYIRQSGKQLFARMDDFVDDVVRKQVYTAGFQKDLLDALMEKYEWGVRIQHEFRIAKEDSANGFIWFRRFSPDRMLMVHWEPYTDEPDVSGRRIIDLRNRLGMTYCDGATIDTVNTDLRFQWVDFAGYTALQMEGLWRIEAKVLGGPFRAHMFLDTDQHRLYFIDYSVFAPSEEKGLFLRQMKVMTQTFKTRI